MCLLCQNISLNVVSSYIWPVTTALFSYIHQTTHHRSCQRAAAPEMCVMRYYSLKGISSCHGSLIAIATMALHPASLVFCFITHDDLVLERLECKGGLVVRNSFEAPKIVAVPSKKKTSRKTFQLSDRPREAANLSSMYLWSLFLQLIV